MQQTRKKTLMSKTLFQISIALVAVVFMIIFCVLVFPPLLQNPDIIGAFAAGFVNPYASAYATDAVCCWVVLLFWVIYEYPKIKYGWVCLLLGLVPGAAVGFGVYLILRTKEID